MPTVFSYAKGVGYIDKLPTAEEITKAVISGCKGLPWAVIELNIAKALKEFDNLCRQECPGPVVSEDVQT
ncbi:MAG: hypothetical protein ACYC4E_00175 [Carboxydocellales bacterium]